MQNIIAKYNNMLKQTVKLPKIIITDSAWSKMSAIIKTKSAHGFIFSAVSGGCNGLNYRLKLFNDKDEIPSCGKITPSKIEKQGVEVYVDPMSEMFLLGTTIDYISEDYDKGIFENKFTFAPDKNIATSCGCGVSFSPKDS